MTGYQYHQATWHLLGMTRILITLEIEFHSGGIYQYRGVPPSIHMGLMGAGSHGRYFHAYLKDRFPFVKLR